MEGVQNRKHQLTKSYDRNITPSRFTTQLEPMMHSRPLIGKQQGNSQSRLVINMGSDDLTGAQLHGQASPWGKGVVSSTRVNQHSSLRDLD